MSSNIGNLGLSNPTGNVSFTINGESSGYSVTCSFNGSGYITIYDGQSTSGTKLVDDVNGYTGTITSSSGYLYIVEKYSQLCTVTLTGGVNGSTNFDGSGTVYSITNDGSISQNGPWYS